MGFESTCSDGGKSGSGDDYGYGTASKEEVSKPFDDYANHRRSTTTTNKWYRTLMGSSSPFVLLFVIVAVGIGCISVNDLDFFSLSSSSSSSTAVVTEIASLPPPRKDKCPSYDHYLSYTENTECFELFFTDNAKRDYELDQDKKIESAQKINSEILSGVLCKDRDKYHNQSLKNDFVPHKPVKEYDTRACLVKVYARDQLPKCNQSDLQVVNNIYTLEPGDCIQYFYFRNVNDPNFPIQWTNPNYPTKSTNPPYHRVDNLSNNWDRNSLTINVNGANNYIQFKFDDSDVLNIFLIKPGYNGECEFDGHYHSDSSKHRFVSPRSVGTGFYYYFELSTSTQGCGIIPHCVMTVSSSLYYPYDDDQW